MSTGSAQHRAGVSTAPDGTSRCGYEGAKIWCGHGVFAHNLVMIGALAA